jgi:2-aminoadipate transaminase
MTEGISTLYSQRATQSLESPLISTYRDSSTIRYRLGTGLPDTGLFPIAELEEYATRALRERGVECLAYGMGGRGGFAGPLSFRETLAKRTFEHDGRDVGADGIVLASGASHGLSLAANAYLSPGDAVLVESYSWPWALRFMTDAGATIAPVPMDDDGMIVDELEPRIQEVKASGKCPKMIYTIPTFHIPTGTCMPKERRLDLLEVAQRHKLIVLEDNLYFDLRYKGETVPSLLALDESGLVLQSNGFSKTLACGLRMAWVAGTPEATLPLELVRQDLGVNQWTAHMLSMWVSDGRWDVHLERILASARSKYEVTLLALRKYCEPYVHFFVPDGGIYFWLKFAPEVDPDKFCQRIEADGVGVAPGERFSPGQQAALPGWDIHVGDGFFRIAFVDVPEDSLEKSIAVLGKCLADSAT